MSNPSPAWLQRRWLDFRNGHSIYLVFAMSFSNFILITHRLLIQDVPILQLIFPHLWLFALVFILAYLPAAILIGYWHRRKQWRVEQTLLLYENPVYARIMRVLLDAVQGRAGLEEVREVRELLVQIEAGRGVRSPAPSP